MIKIISRRRNTIISLLCFILLSNPSPLKWVYSRFDQDDYEFSACDGLFTFSETQFKGKDFSMYQDTFEKLKELGELSSSTILYMLNKNDVSKLWRYGNYML